MSNSLAARIHDELKKTVLIDPHSHINPHAPASETLADLLGYHYYTELAHSAGLPRERIEPTSGQGNTVPVPPREKVSRLMEHLGTIDNTVQWSWMLDLCRELFDWESDRIDQSNWEKLYDQAEKICRAADWEDQVLQRSGVESIFLTNDFDDSLQGFDRQRYVPCLRTDDLVFHLAKPTVVSRLEKCTQISIRDLNSLTRAITALFDHFSKNGARACAISLPPDFSPCAISDSAAEQGLSDILKNSDYSATVEARSILSRWTFWTLAKHAAEYRMPFDLMIGVNRQVYPGGVFQGQDLYDSRVSMIQYAPLFNTFPNVIFPISVLASVTNQELVDYSWIFPNVVTNGHWWYSNTPSIIHRDLSARLEAIPRTKQIGYYSDAYKLEFILPKFGMYRRILARILADDFAIARNWSEDQCIALGKQVLRGNVERIFNVG